jgi:hypothetical protein
LPLRFLLASYNWLATHFQGKLRASRDPARHFSPKHLIFEAFGPVAGSNARAALGREAFVSERRLREGSRKLADS